MRNNSGEHNSALIKYQRLVRLFCLIYFSIVSGHLVMNSSAAKTMGHLGVKIVLAATIGQLVVMAYQFRKSDNKRFVWLSYTLLAVIIVSSAIGSLLL